MHLSEHLRQFRPAFGLIALRRTALNQLLPSFWGYLSLKNEFFSISPTLAVDLLSSGCLLPNLHYVASIFFRHEFYLNYCHTILPHHGHVFCIIYMHENRLLTTSTELHSCQFAFSSDTWNIRNYSFARCLLLMTTALQISRHQLFEKCLRENSIVFLLFSTDSSLISNSLVLILSIKHHMFVGVFETSFIRFFVGINLTQNN